MGIIGLIVLGGLAGWVASMIAKTNESMGAFANIAVGIIGAFLGNLIFSLLGSDGLTGFNLWSFIVALIGSVVLLFVVRAFHDTTS